MRAVHTTTAMLGFAVLFVGIVLLARPDLRQASESRMYSLLQYRSTNSLGLKIEPQAHERATAVNMLELTPEQASIAFWLSKKYRVAPEPLGALVVQAYELGERHQLDPKLILSVMAIESRFNPFAQSSVGAQGLMQVMTQVHEDKYEHFGGKHAAFDPLTNLQVGAVILQDCINRFGGVQNGLRCYVGAAKLPSDGGYAAKVLAEHERLEKVVKEGVSALPQSYRDALRAQRQAAHQPENEIKTAAMTTVAAGSELGKSTVESGKNRHSTVVNAKKAQSSSNDTLAAVESSLADFDKLDKKQPDSSWEVSQTSLTGMR